MQFCTTVWMEYVVSILCNKKFSSLPSFCVLAWKFVIYNITKLNFSRKQICYTHISNFRIYYPLTKYFYILNEVEGHNIWHQNMRNFFFGKKIWKKIFFVTASREYIYTYNEVQITWKVLLDKFQRKTLKYFRAGKCTESVNSIFESEFLRPHCMWWWYM